VFERDPDDAQRQPPRLPLKLSPDDLVERLVRSAQAGSKVAFDALVERYAGALFNFLNLRIGSAADAEEVAQETFLRAWQKIERYDSRWSFSTWLFTLGKRLAASRLRRSTLPTVALDAADQVTDAHEPSRLACDREESRNLWDLATRILNPDQRSVLWLRYAEDLPIDQVARILGRRATTVRVLLFRARAKLAQRMQRDDRMSDEPHERSSFSSLSKAIGEAG